MEVIVGATVGAVLLIMLIVYGIVKLYNRGKREGTLIVVPQRSPTQISENLATAFPVEIPSDRMNALAEEVAMLRARPNVVTKGGKPYIVVRQSRKSKRRNQK